MFLLPRYQERSTKLCTNNLVLLNSVSFNGIQSTFQRSEMFLAMLMFLLDYGNVSYFPWRLVKKKINVKVLAFDQSCREKRKTDQELSLDGWREREKSLTQLLNWGSTWTHCVSEDDFEPCNSNVKCWNYSQLLLHPTVNPCNVYSRTWELGQHSALSYIPCLNGYYVNKLTLYIMLWHNS